jgi:hypothetical protein
VPATEIVVLHDPEAREVTRHPLLRERGRLPRGDEALSAMPADETPGQRTSVTKYDVAFRMAD